MDCCLFLRIVVCSAKYFSIDTESKFLAVLVVTHIVCNYVHICCGRLVRCFSPAVLPVLAFVLCMLEK